MDAEDWKEAIAELDKPLDGRHVKSRSQAGRTLSYVENWLAIAEANRIFGFNKWNAETTELKCVTEKPRKIGRPPNEKDGWGVSYIAKTRITVGGVIREGVGAGHGIDADLGLAHESAIKEAESDSQKRALRTFGNPFGLALYDKTQANVDHDSQQEPRRAAPAPATAPPSNSAAFQSLKDKLDECGHERAVTAWVEEVKQAVQSGAITLSERATLATLRDNKLGILAQRPAA